MKKLTKILVSLLLVSIFLVACSSTKKEDTKSGEAQNSDVQTVGVILGVGGLGDQSYNDVVFSGMEKVKADLGINFDYAEPKQISEFELIMRDMATSGKYSVIICVGYDQVDPLAKICGEFPEQNFAIIDGVVEAPNVASYTSKEEEGSFLVGALAALMTKEGNPYGISGDLGFVGALDIPIIQKFNAGFQAGARYVNPEIKIIADFVSGDKPFSDTTTAKEIALSQANKGAKIIYHAAGGSGLGVFQAAKEGDFYAIGCNSNQNIINPDKIVASMLKRVDTAAYEISKSSVIDKNLSVGKITVLGTDKEGVGYTIEGSNKTINAQDQEIIEKIKQDIASGKIVVPETVDKVEEFLSNNQYK